MSWSSANHGGMCSTGSFYDNEPPTPTLTMAEAVLLADGLLASGASDVQIMTMLTKVGYGTQARIMVAEAMRQRKADAPPLSTHRAIALDGKF